MTVWVRREEGDEWEPYERVDVWDGSWPDVVQVCLSRTAKFSFDLSELPEGSIITKAHLRFEFYE